MGDEQVIGTTGLPPVRIRPTVTRNADIAAHIQEYPDASSVSLHESESSLSLAPSKEMITPSQSDASLMNPLEAYLGYRIVPKELKFVSVSRKASATPSPQIEEQNSNDLANLP